MLAAEIDDLKSIRLLLYAIGDELKSEINRLKLENTSLLERNLNLLCIVSDLNTKIKDLENDKMSLMTAIKLLQVDVNVQGETTVSWTEIRSNKKAESKHRTDSSNASRSSVITVDDSLNDKPKGPSVRVNTNRFSLEGTATSANEERNSNVNVITPNTSDDRSRKNDQRQKSSGDGFQGNTSAERSRKNDQRQMSRSWFSRKYIR